MTVRGISLWLLLMCISWAAVAEQSSDGKTIGLALAGGGALGFAHAGVILELEAAGVPVHYVAGTSMGSIAAALYAAGYTGEQMREIVKTTNWNELFVDSRPRRYLSYYEKRADKSFLFNLNLSPEEGLLASGVSAGQNVVELMDRLLRGYALSGSFDRFPRPLRVVATDLISGEEVIFDKGDLKSAIRASMAVPGVFTPLSYHDRLLIDGGWVNVLPVDAVRSMGADYIIAVNLNILSTSEEELDSLPAVLTQSSHILRLPRLKQNLAQADLVINPDVSDYTKVSFDRALELVEEGRRAARKVIPQLKALATEAAETPISRVQPAPNADQTIHITRVSYAGEEATSAQQTQLVKQLLGETTVSEVQAQIRHLYDIGRYEYVSYELLPYKKGIELVLHLAPIEKPTASIRAGYYFRSEPFSGISPSFTLLSNFTHYGAGKEGIRWSTDFWLSENSSVQTEYEYPLAEPLSLLSSLYTVSKPLFSYQDRRVTSTYLRRRSGASLGMRTQLFDTMEFTAAGRAEWVDVSLREGSDLGLDSNVGEIGFSVDGVLDNFNRYPFPTRGTETVLNYEYRYQPETGLTYNTASFEQQYYIELPAEGTFGIGYKLATDLDSDAPSYCHSSLGGFGSFAGLHDQELTSRHSAVYSSQLRIPLFPLPIGFGDMVYGSLRGNIGNVWDEDVLELLRQQPDFIVGGSIGLSADTIFGELHLHFALATGDKPAEDALRYAVYLVLGNGGFNPFQ
ncbi:MAG: patatin-like phospholipase family protein [Spirochaetaceae bacterium]|nr:patatin-like phospholipase family protein [Spirochaetaceae bacterium]MCF7947255.1 patatin-like phospholipase family protein [Spirochaetia bacterium]MCF7950294.1 patatin-like phospholipase family protein [Spirochaetaceae bacterium]